MRFEQARIWSRRFVGASLLIAAMSCKGSSDQQQNEPPSAQKEADQAQKRSEQAYDKAKQAADTAKTKSEQARKSVEEARQKQREAREAQQKAQQAAQEADQQAQQARQEQRQQATPQTKGTHQEQQPKAQKPADEGQQPQAPQQGTEQGQQSRAPQQEPGAAPMGATGTARGTVQRVSPDEVVVERQGAPDLHVKIDPQQTTVTKNGQSASQSDLQQGVVVSIEYQIKNDQPVAKRVDVLELGG